MMDEQTQEHQAHVLHLSRKLLTTVAEKRNTPFAQLTFLMKDKND